MSSEEHQPHHGTSINAVTRTCAVLGWPIHHSASPAMQNAGIQALKLNWRYMAYPVPPDDLPLALHGARAMHFLGLNLTVPHKLLAVELMDILDSSAQRWGAVNTVVFETQTQDGEWVPLAQIPPHQPPAKLRAKGYNTDADAITRALSEDLGLELGGKRVLLLGAGGAARAAALKLASEEVSHLYLVNRTRSKAEALANEISRQFPAVRAVAEYPTEDVDLTLNATSLGLRPEDPLPFDATQFSLKKTRSAFDMIYQPAETPFLKTARELGIKTANGLGMLLYQGAKALELWSGLPAPIEPMRVALQKHIYG